MGNSLGGRRKTAKIMKVDGETFKIKTPMLVEEIVKDYPNHVLIESKAVKNLGINAKPLESYQQLKPKQLYFLVELPKVIKSPQKVPRRVRSGIQMTAKDRLESLKLSRRSVSDLTIMKSRLNFIHDEQHENNSSSMRIRVRLPKAQVEKLVEESKDGVEAAEKIMDLCIGKEGNGKENDGYEEISPGNSGELFFNQHNQYWKPSLGSIEEKLIMKRGRKVGFLTNKD